MVQNPKDTEVFDEISDDISDVSWWDVPALLLFAVLLVIVALQFFTRYVLNDSFGWTEEIARYLLIMTGFIGAVGCVRKGGHIALEFAYHYVPQSIIKPCVLVCEALVCGFWGCCAWLAMELSERTYSNMVSIDLPKAIIYYVVCAGCALMAAWTLRNLITCWRTPAEQVIAAKLKNL